MDTELGRALQNVDNLLTEAMQSLKSTDFLVCISKALGMVEVLARFDYIDNDTFDSYLNRVNGLLSLLDMSLLDVQP